MLFANDIDRRAGDEQELAKLVKQLDTTSAAYGMEINAKKTKLITNNADGINTDFRVCGKKYETFNSFKYLGLVVTDEGLYKQQLQ